MPLQTVEQGWDASRRELEQRRPPPHVPWLPPPLKGGNDHFTTSHVRRATDQL